MTRTKALDSLTALLEEQRQALLTGDLAVLDQLPDRLERAMRDLAQTRPDAAELAHLAQMAARNARLVLSARDGLALARRDIGPAGQLTTYDAMGRQRGPHSAGQMIARR